MIRRRLEYVRDYARNRRWCRARRRATDAVVVLRCSLSSAVFRPDGTRIVAAADDESARIFDVSSAAMSVQDLITEVDTAYGYGNKRRRNRTKSQLRTVIALNGSDGVPSIISFRQAALRE